MNEPYKDWIVRYYASHDDIPPGHTDGELTELIRCKDCKWYEMGEEETYCRELGIFNTDPTSYCSYAKRKEE